MTNAIAKPQPAELYGHTDRIIALSDRMRNMIPGASEAPAAIIWRAAQIAHLHRLDPFSGDIYVYPAYKGCKDDEWIIDVGVAAWRRAAQRQAKYHIRHEVLPDNEIQDAIGEHYTPGDVGVRATLYRLDIARECKDLDIPYEPTIAYGFFRQKARYIKPKSIWIADQLANTETKQDKATKRSEKKALKIAFSLDFADEVMQRNNPQWQLAEGIEHKVISEEQNRLPVFREEPNREEDGDILWA